MNAIENIVLGAAIGSLAAVISEAFVRPRLDRRSLAELLAVDLSVHMQAIVAELAPYEHNNRSVPLPRPFPLPMYPTIVARLGELPAEIVGDALLVYRLLDRLNEIASRAAAAFERMKGADASGEAIPDHLEEDLASNLASYVRFLRNAAERVNTLQPKLIAIASPWWSPRFRRTPRPEYLDAGELARRVGEMKLEHEQNVREIRKDPAGS